MRTGHRAQRHRCALLILSVLVVIGIVGWVGLSRMGSRLAGYVSDGGHVQAVEEGGGAGAKAQDSTEDPTQEGPTGADVLDDGVVVPGDDQGAVASTSTGPEGPCPLSLADAVLESRHENAAGTSWVLLTQATARDVGEEVLCQLASDGWSLEQAGYLGLDDTAWGCVATSGDRGRVVMVYAVPQVLGAVRSEENLLRISVMALVGGER